MAFGALAAGALLAASLAGGAAQAAPELAACPSSEDADALREVALSEFEGEPTDGRMEGRSGNSCIRHSAPPFDVLIEEAARLREDGWTVSEGTCPPG